MPDIDTVYARLKTRGYGGWGGPNFERRLAGWTETLDWLQRDNLIPPPPQRALELGCGNGLVAIAAARRGYDVTGIDLSGEAIAWSRERAEMASIGVSFHEGDVRAMPFSGGVFDIVIDGNCLHCILGDDRKQCLNDVMRVLRPGGIFVVSTMCGDPKSGEACSRFDRASRVLLEVGRPHRVLKPAEEIESEVMGAGFRVIERKMAINPWWDHLTLVAVAAAHPRL